MRIILLITITLISNVLSSQVLFRSQAIKESVAMHIHNDSTKVVFQNQIDTITTLNLENTGVRYLDDLSLFNSLQTLFLSHNDVQDISIINDLPKINYVDLSFNNFESIDELSFVDNKELTIDVTGNYIKNFEFISGNSFSNLVFIGDNYQLEKPDGYQVNDLFVRTDKNGQAIIYYNLTDLTGKCNEFQLGFGDGKSESDLECTSKHIALNHTYDGEGLQKLELSKDVLSEKAVFIPPFSRQVSTGNKNEILLDLPSDVLLKTVSSNDGTTSIENNSLYYTPNSTNQDTLRVNYRYQDSNYEQTFFVITEVSLPVKIIIFDIVSSGQDALLYWKTESEINNDRFEIERSIDGQSFDYIGQVQGNGTSTTTQEYTYIDEGIGLDNTLVFYRLKQLDSDGTYEYSDIKSVQFNHNTITSVYPNPSDGRNIKVVSDRIYKIEVYDTSGRQVYSSSYDSVKEVTLPYSIWNSGLYTIVINEKETKKIIIHK